MMGVQQFYQPPYLGAGEVKGRYEPPPPLPWYHTNQTALTFCFVLALALVLGTGMALG